MHTKHTSTHTHQVLEILERLLGRLAFARLALGRRQVLVIVVVTVRLFLLTHMPTQTNAASVLALGTRDNCIDALVWARFVVGTLLLVATLDGILDLVHLFTTVLFNVGIVVAILVVVCNRERKR